MDYNPMESLKDAAGEDIKSTLDSMSGEIKDAIEYAIEQVRPKSVRLGKNIGGEVILSSSGKDYDFFVCRSFEDVVNEIYDDIFGPDPLYQTLEEKEDAQNAFISALRSGADKLEAGSAK